jgi:hypothetical protein
LTRERRAQTIGLTLGQGNRAYWPSWSADVARYRYYQFSEARLRKLVRLWLITFSIVLPTGAFSQSSVPTVERYQYESCLDYARRSGLDQQHIYIAWAGGIAHACLHSDYPPDAARRSVVAQCERAVSQIRSRFGYAVPCRIVRDRGQIVDEVYRRALRSRTAIPVQLQVFDAASGNLQTANGTYESVVTRFNGPNPAEERFEIKARGIVLCRGTLTARFFADGFNYEATCFQQTFRGSANPEKVISYGGRHGIVPNEIRLSRGGSWISVRP